MPSAALLAVGLVLFLLLLPPTRRLQRSGWSPRALGAYLTSMLCLGLAVPFLPISARFVVPILILGYLAPFVVARLSLDGLRRVSRSGMEVARPPIKTVTGPARDVPGTSPAAQPDSDAEVDAGATGDALPADEQAGDTDLGAR